MKVNTKEVNMLVNFYIKLNLGRIFDTKGLSIFSIFHS